MSELTNGQNAEGILEFENVHFANFNESMDLGSNKQRILHPLGRNLRGKL